MKKQNILIIIVAVASISLIIILAYSRYHQDSDNCKTGCTDTTIQKAKELKEKMYKKITPEQAREEMENEKGLILLDVRTQKEYQEGHLTDSILIPLDSIEQNIEEKITNKNQTILVYCRSGSRSKQAAMLLINKGYTKVIDIGGIIDWPYEIIK